MAINVGGRIVVLKANGARSASVSAPDVQSVALSRTELAIAGRSMLGLYDPATGHLRKSIALGPAAGLQLAGIAKEASAIAPAAPHARANGVPKRARSVRRTGGMEPVSIA
jgi:hypothetical protein